VQAWASSYSGILLSLSGGLDSSILYAALRDTPAKQKLTCFHYYPTGSDMDERRFARLVAKSGGSDLIERARDSASISLEPLLDIEASPEPANYLYFIEHSRLDAQLAADHHATAAFVGWGGDQLFYQERALFAAGDYLHYRGLRPELLRIALDSANMDRVSVWQVLREALAQYSLGRSWSIRDDIADFRPMLRPEVIEEVYRSAAHQLSSPWEFYDPLGRPDDAERVSPLYSQPTIELCLRLPLHVLTLGGWDRAIARRAFYDELPREIVNRKDKGGTEEHLRGILRNNIAFVRELLLDGALVREGIVDRSKLSIALSGRASRIQASSSELFDFIAAEVWLRRWQRQA
jgi:asparagine synthase (glutamine-hydrolysing)